MDKLTGSTAAQVRFVKLLPMNHGTSLLAFQSRGAPPAPAASPAALRTSNSHESGTGASLKRVRHATVACSSDRASTSDAQMGLPFAEAHDHCILPRFRI